MAPASNAGTAGTFFIIIKMTPTGTKNNQGVILNFSCKANCN